MLTIGNDAQFQRFCKFANCEELAGDERYKSNSARVKNRDALILAMQPVMASKTSNEWFTALQKLTIGCGPINSIEQVFNDKHVQERGMIIKMPHDAVGGRSISLVGSPLNFSETPVTYRHSPPILGAHTEEVLQEVLKLQDEEISQLKGQSVI